MPTKQLSDIITEHINRRLKKYHFLCTQCNFSVTVESFNQQDALGQAFSRHDEYRSKIGRDCPAKNYEISDGKLEKFRRTKTPVKKGANNEPSNM